jgi:hypothetical protein
MPHTDPGFIISPEFTRAFMIRLTWDAVAEQWHILLKPVSGEAAAHFRNLEAAFHYLEAVMTDQRQQKTDE